MSPAAEEPIQIASGDGWLSACYYRPAGPAAAACVICDPLFEERKSAQRPLVELARRLRGAGVGAIRFDYRGCGDSSGDLETTTAHDWLADLDAAVGQTRESFGPMPLILVGVRLGGTLLLKWAARHPEAALAILWEPVVSPGEYLRHELRRKLMKEMLTFGGSRSSRDALMEELERGGEVDFDGYGVTAALYRSLLEIELRPDDRPRLGDTLLIHLSPVERVADSLSGLGRHLESAGNTVTLRALRHQPFWNQIGYTDCTALLDETMAWVGTRILVPPSPPAT